MKDNSLMKVGGATAILLGIAKLFSGVGYLLIPLEQRATMPGPKFLPSFAQNPTLLTAIFWSEALVGILGLAVVPAVSNLVRSKNEGWVRWTASLATVGFAVSAVGYMLSVARLPGIAKAFVAGDASTKAALAVVWKASPDLFGFWGYGAIGIWVLVVSILALHGTAFPRLHSYLGFLLAILYALIPLGVIPKVQTLILISAAVGALVGPIWYIWTGLILRRTPSEP